jgi:osmoprotectant transport system substrate-binding protein
MSARANSLRLLFVVALAALLAGCSVRKADTIVVGSKNFPEQALLGEILAQHLEAKTHLRVERRFYLAGTYICQQAMLAGRVDMYVEYTGTALTAILHDPVQANSSAVLDQVRSEYAQRFQMQVFPSLGFNNTFAMVIRGDDARRLHIATLSQAGAYAPQWRAGFGYEFMERPDGFDGLARSYGLHFAAQPSILDLGLLYRALLDHQIDFIAGSSTDGLLAARDLTVLEDDKHYFPPYDAVPIVRNETLEHHPEIQKALHELARKISDQEMRKLNYEVAGEQRDVADVAHEFLRSKGLD